jgi:glycosyltransferase involved in cell wall biosynthesis
MTESKVHPPLKILMTADTVGGVWTYCVELCRALRDFNVSFHLVTAGAKLQTWQKQEIEDHGNVTVHETDFLLEWMKNPWESIGESGKMLMELEAKIQPDIIHLNSYSYGSLQWQTPVVIVAHSDVFSWWEAVIKTPPSDEFNEYYIRVKEGLRNADLIIAPSKNMLHNLQHIYSINNNCKVIYNARRRELFYEAKKQPYIMCMGRLWDEGKNLKLLIDAAGKINYTIKIAGENKFHGNDIVVDESNIEYMGNISTADVAKQLSTASTYVLPAKYEPFGLSALEAAISGCALILGDIPSLREIWQDNAIYVDTDDPSSLAKTINKLMENQQQLEYYGQRAKEHTKKFSPETLAENYLNVYRQLQQKTFFKKIEIA